MKYTVNRASGQSAYIQIYRQLRDDIVAGRLKDGAKRLKALRRGGARRERDNGRACVRTA